MTLIDTTAPSQIETISFELEPGPFAAGSVEERSPTELVIRLSEEARGVLTVRNAFHPGWRATADGRPARTLPVDGFLQGVVLPPGGAREVVLTFGDDAVTTGLALGAGVWTLLLVAPLLALVVERRSRATPPRRGTPAA